MPTTTVTQEEVKPKRYGIRIIDLTGGASIKETTDYQTGRVRRIGRGFGGRGISEETRRRLEEERLRKEEELRKQKEAEEKREAEEKEARRLATELEKQQKQQEFLSKQARRETAITSAPVGSIPSRSATIENVNSIEEFNPGGFKPENQKPAYTRRSALKEILTGGTIKNTLEKAKGVVRLESGVGSVFGAFFEPLRYTGKQKGETVVQIPQRGTINVNAPTQKTVFELERENRIASGVSPNLVDLSNEAVITDKATKEASRITKKYQGKVDSGELSVDEANKQAQKEYKTSISDYESRIPKDRNLRRRSGESVVKTIEIGGELATFAVAGRLSPGAIASSIDREALAQATRTSYQTLGREVIRTEGGSVVIAKQFRSTPSVKETVTSIIPTFRQGAERISVTGGRIIREVELDSFKKSIQGYQGKEAKILFSEEGSISARLYGKKVPGIIETEAGGLTLQREIDLTRVYGESDFVSKGLSRSEYVTRGKTTKKVISSAQPNNLVKPSRVASLVNEGETSYDFIAGTPSKVRFYPFEGKTSITLPIKGQGKILKYQEGFPRSEASFALEESLYGGAEKSYSIKGLDPGTRDFVKNLKKSSTVQEKVTGTGGYAGAVIKQSVKSLQTPTLETKIIPITTPKTTQNGGSSALKQTQRQISGLRSAQIIEVAQRQEPRTRSKTRTASGSAVAIAEAVAQKANSAQDVGVKTVLVKKIKTKAKPFPTPSFDSPFGYGYGELPPSIGPAVIPLFKPSGALRGGGVGNVPSRYGGAEYAPSFTALFFKIRGKKKPKGPATGVRFRPITPDYSFQKVRRVKKVRKKRKRS